MMISYLVTRKASFALSIGFVELFTKCLLYFIHERAWNRVRFGQVDHAEKQGASIRQAA